MKGYCSPEPFTGNVVLVGVTLLEGDVGVVLVCNGLGAGLRRELERVCECP